ALDEAARGTGAAAVLLGHTRDDQAESVLLGLARGSGARSLAGMQVSRGVLRRPWLEVTRAQTTRVCQVHGWDPWVDPTDHGGGGAPLRSQVRHRVLPVLEEVLGPGVAAALARTAAQLREDADVLDALAVDVLGRVTLGRWAGRVDLDAAALGTHPAAVRRRVLHRACAQVGVPGGAVRRGHVLDLDALVVDWRGQGPVALPGGGEGRRRCGRLTVAGSPTGGGQDDREQ
ncbi:tRNA(Ile)-lysidine synthase, partial [Cellulomonas bogoriensis 69B4 = DSM 16987]